MKKLIYLIPVSFLIACSGTREVYDDVYAPVIKQEKVIENDDLGYADYVKNSESEYKVEVEESIPNPNAGRTIIPDRGYSTQSGDIIINNYERGSNNSYFGSDYYYNDPYWGNNWNSWNNWNGWNNWGGCRYRCSYFYNFGHCCHFRYRNSWNWGFGYNNWYGCGNYWNYGSPYWQPGGWYAGNYYGYSFHPYYGWGYWGFWGVDPLNNYPYGNPNNSVAWNGNDVIANSNHHYGHRGSVNSESSNTTAYEHTVMSQVAVNDGKPFTEYVADQSITGANYATSLSNDKEATGKIMSKPLNAVNGGSVTGINEKPGVIYNTNNTNSGNTASKNNVANKEFNTVDKPSAINQIEPGTINTSLWDKPNNNTITRTEPVYSNGNGVNNSNSQVSSVQTKPATNKFSSGNVSSSNSGNTNSNINQNSSPQKYQTNTYSGSGNYSGNNQYNTSNNPNYIQNNYNNNYQNNQRTYSSGSNNTTTNRTNSSNRSTYNSNNSNRGSGTYSNRSGSSNRSSSSSTRSSSSRSSGSGSGSGSSGSSRRR